jgi:hypothetical protein
MTREGGKVCCKGPQNAGRGWRTDRRELPASEKSQRLVRVCLNLKTVSRPSPDARSTRFAPNSRRREIPSEVNLTGSEEVLPKPMAIIAFHRIPGSLSPASNKRQRPHENWPEVYLSVDSMSEGRLALDMVGSEPDNTASKFRPDGADCNECHRHPQIPACLFGGNRCELGMSSSVT